MAICHYQKASNDQGPAIDVFYAAVGRISPVYLLDAVAEIVLAAMWIIGLRASSRLGEAQG